jgi:hypothetical protein
VTNMTRPSLADEIAFPRIYALLKADGHSPAKAADPVNMLRSEGLQTELEPGSTWWANPNPPPTLVSCTGRLA